MQLFFSLFETRTLLVSLAGLELSMETTGLEFIDLCASASHELGLKPHNTKPAFYFAAQIVLALDIKALFPDILTTTAPVLCAGA